MKNTMKLAIAVLLLGASSLMAQTTAVTKPSGFVTYTLKAGQFNLIGLTLHNPALVAGSFTVVSGTTLTDSKIDFDSVLTDGKTYILEITEDVDTANGFDLTGTTEEVVAWSGNAITTPDDMSSKLSVGDKYQIREAATLASVFGVDNSAGLPSGGSVVKSAVVWVQDTTEADGFAEYYYKASVFGRPAGWKKLALGGELDVDPATVPLIYTDALYIKMPDAPQDTDIVLTGTVKTKPTLIALTETFNRVAVVYPVGSTLQNSGLQESLTSSGASAKSDIVFIQQPSGDYKQYYYKASVFGAPAAWKELLSDGGEVDAPADVSLESGILIQQVGADKSIKLTPAYSE